MGIKPYYDRLLGRIRDDYGVATPVPGYDLPFFQTFDIAGQPNPIEVGDSILANRTFNWSTGYPANIAPNSIAIDDITGATNIATGLANTPPYVSVYPAITNLVAATNLFRISGQNTLAGLFFRMYTVSWQWMVYYGEAVAVGPLLEAQIEALRVPVLKAGFAGVYVFLAGGYKYLCYPATLGTATSFVDQATGFPVAMLPVYTVSVTNAFGVITNYNVHRTWNPLGGALNIVVN